MYTYQHAWIRMQIDICWWISDAVGIAKAKKLLSLIDKITPALSELQ